MFVNKLWTKNKQRNLPKPIFLFWCAVFFSNKSIEKFSKNLREIFKKIYRIKKKKRNNEKFSKKSTEKFSKKSTYFEQFLSKI